MGIIFCLARGSRSSHRSCRLGRSPDLMSYSLGGLMLFFFFFFCKEPLCAFTIPFESSLEIDSSSLEALSPKRSRLTALVAAARSLFGRGSLRSALQSKQEPHIPWYRSPSVALLPVSVLVLFQVCCWAIPSGDASDFGAPSYCTVRDSKLPLATNSHHPLVLVYTMVRQRRKRSEGRFSCYTSSKSSLGEFFCLYF